jgi:hypothetical protein
MHSINLSLSKAQQAVYEWRSSFGKQARKFLVDLLTKMTTDECKLYLDTALGDQLLFCYSRPHVRA